MEAFGHVTDYATKKARRRTALTTWVSREIPAKDVDYPHQKIFSERENVAAGHIQLEHGAGKLNKTSKDMCVLPFVY